ncbi:MAG TPA: hypothetical protein VK909_11255, partial [Anaerolineales bacterium]|nr:hypothetical protein [Anaerolineales bacterium]
MKRKSAVGWTFMWILLLAGVLAFLPQAPLVEPTTGNLVPNGDFSSAMSGWGWYLAPNAMAYRSIVNGEIYVQIPDDGDATSHIQVNRPNLTIVNGRQYALYFDARAASGTRNIVASVSMME